MSHHLRPMGGYEYDAAPGVPRQRREVENKAGWIDLAAQRAEWQMRHGASPLSPGIAALEEERKAMAFRITALVAHLVEVKAAAAASEARALSLEARLDRIARAMR